MKYRLDNKAHNVSLPGAKKCTTVHVPPHETQGGGTIGQFQCNQIECFFNRIYQFPLE